MSNLIIDSGSYSVKFIEGKFQRKNFKIESYDEVLLADIRDPSDTETTDLEYQQQIIKQYLEQTKFTGKIIYQLSNNFLTTRYMDLPVQNKKKAELMIPFQLDEDLPFPANEAHYTNTFYKNTNGNFSSVVQITEDETFKDLHSAMKMNHTIPSVLTSELSVFQSYIEDRKFGGHVCIIDIGHNTTKAYLAFNDKLLSNHISSIAGSTFDEVIASTYDISADESRIYKHENAFFLTDGQLDQVSADQREFAIIMKQACSPLIQQLQRWLLGYRIKTGFSIEKVYICGGTSNIKNIDTFLTERLETPVEVLKITSLESQVNPREGLSLTLPYLMAQSQKFKTVPVSFLTKNYASGLLNGVTLEDSAFNFYRIALVALVISLGVNLETFLFLEKSKSDYNASVRKTIKDPELDVPVKLQKSFLKKPETVSKYLSTKEKVVAADLKILQATNTSNAIIPLAKLSAGIKRNEKVSLISFTSKDNTNIAKFKGDTQRDIMQVKELIKTLNFDGLNIKESADPLNLEISFNSGN
ncbi:pilus assembly protein PilM [Bacteriovorax sp. Seq25_V]|uniref:pilus assembly protein PilM n=1 Tax=Bacteriovorax sp. Seq25_V TaxID=1201288 RepID=UPI00038A1AFD|nr:pilus assembly protein PilM [Bacteriovorax sp. Seq25_V]EQC46073.1 hypothetical protein M900_1664 [Bacteriovorax sp. Seq25_V]